MENRSYTRYGDADSQSMEQINLLFELTINSNVFYLKKFFLTLTRKCLIPFYKKKIGFNQKLP